MPRRGSDRLLVSIRRDTAAEILDLVADRLASLKVIDREDHAVRERRLQAERDIAAAVRAFDA